MRWHRLLGTTGEWKIVHVTRHVIGCMLYIMRYPGCTSLLIHIYLHLSVNISSNGVFLPARDNLFIRCRRCQMEHVNLPKWQIYGMYRICSRCAPRARETESPKGSSPDFIGTMTGRQIGMTSVQLLSLKRFVRESPAPERAGWSLIRSCAARRWTAVAVYHAVIANREQGLLEYLCCLTRWSRFTGLQRLDTGHPKSHPKVRLGVAGVKNGKWCQRARAPTILVPWPVAKLGGQQQWKSSRQLLGRRPPGALAVPEWYQHSKTARLHQLLLLSRTIQLYYWDTTETTVSTLALQVLTNTAPKQYKMSLNYKSSSRDRHKILSIQTTFGR